MPTILDLLYVALFAVVLPLWDAIFSWPAFLRKIQTDPARARKQTWTGAIVYAWPLVALGAAIWVANDRSWASFGFSVPDGWRLWTAIALVLLVALYHVYAVATVARSAEAQESIRQQQFGAIPTLMPQTRADLGWWGGVSLTAGFCEEFLYRGYFIWVFAPWLGWWGAAAVSLAFFAAGHAYQGWKGVLRTGIVAGVFTVVVAVFDSLWPAIALHALVDLGGGVMAWLAVQEAPTKDRPEIDAA